MKLKPGRKYLTREGLQARCLCVDMKTRGPFSAVVLIEIDGVEHAQTVTPEGRWGGRAQHHWDLVKEDRRK